MLLVFMNMQDWDMSAVPHHAVVCQQGVSTRADAQSLVRQVQLRANGLPNHRKTQSTDPPAFVVVIDSIF